MKKVFVAIILSLAISMAFVACNPDKEKKEIEKNGFFTRKRGRNISCGRLFFGYRTAYAIHERRYLTNFRLYVIIQEIAACLQELTTSPYFNLKIKKRRNDRCLSIKNRQIQRRRFPPMRIIV